MDLLGQMATFVRVVDGNSLSAAARGLRLSLPAVSRQLRALETELGTSLVVRSTRSLRVTDAGRRWYEHCVRVLRDVEDAKSAVRGVRAARGTLTVSASVSFGLQLVVPHLCALAAAHPHLVVDLRLEDRVVDLVGDGVDLALRAGMRPPDTTAYVATPLLAMTRIVVASPGWLRAHKPKEPHQLAKLPCLVQVTSSGSIIRWHLQRGTDTSTVEVAGPVRSNAPFALRDLAIAGLGAAYIPELLVANELASGTLKRVLPAWSSPPVIAHAIYRTELRGDPRIRAFLAALALLPH